MQTFDSFMSWCIQQYHSPHECTNCTNDNYCDGTAGNCYNCVKHVHDVHNNQQTYNCQNQIYCYIQKHFYRFVSEMLGIYERFRMAEILPNIRIASIGTGPSSELYAYQEYLERNPTINQQFSFVGFDNNKIWQQINVHTTDTFQNVVYSDSNFFDYYEHQEEKPNIIILNYLLSDMTKFEGHDITKLFLNNLIAFVSTLPYECYILCNDIMYLGSASMSKINSSYPAYLYLLNLTENNQSYERCCYSYDVFRYTLHKTYRKFLGINWRTG